MIIRLGLLLICSTTLQAAELDTANRPPDLSPEIRQRTLQYLEYASSPAEASAQLLAVEQLGDIDRSSASAAQGWIGWYQKLNPYDRANTLALARGADWSVSKQNDFWLGQAQAMLQRGQSQHAERALRRIRETQDLTISEQRQTLLGLILIQQGRFIDALNELENRQGFPHDSLYNHYNFGVALVGQRRKGEGLALLDELGQTSAGTGKENHALLDRANLAVGWDWLAAQQGGTARAFFKRVSLDGPYSNMALLGLGWAELAPDGKPQEAHFTRDLMCDDVTDPPVSVSMLLLTPTLFCRPGTKASSFKYRHLFAYQPGARGAERFRRALRPWLVLDQQSIHDPTVQEATLAIAYANDRLGDYQKAESAYRYAIRRFETEQKRLDALDVLLREREADVQTILEQQTQPGEFSSVQNQARAAYLVNELDDLGTSAQELRTLRSRLQRFTPTGDTQNQHHQQLLQRWQILDESLSASRVTLGNNLKQIYLEDLAGRRQRLNQYLARAVLGLAVLYDRRGDSPQPVPH